jgi:uncharacterized membrane protein
MRTKLDRYDVLTGIVVLSSVAVTALLYDSLPERVPSHFALDGHANGWQAKALGAWILPGVASGLWLLLRVAPAVLPLDWKERAERSPMSLAALAIVVLLSLAQVDSLYAAFHPQVIMGWAFVVALSVYFVLMGQLMPRVRRNPWLGVRTAWTLSSDENWLRTHRFAGYAMTLGGLAAIGFAFVSPTLAVAAIIGSALSPVVYSFLLARRLQA